jgi:hypothetical protein
MSEPIEAVAERFRRHLRAIGKPQGPYHDSPYFWGDNNGSWWDSSAMKRDAERLAARYVHPLDGDEPVTPEWLRQHGFHRPMQPAAGNMMASPGCEHAGNGTVIYHITIEFPTTRKLGVLPIWAVAIMGYRRIESNAPPTRRWIRELHEALKLPWENDQHASG